MVLQQFTLTALVQGADPSTTFTVNVTEGVGNTYGATVVDLDPMTPAVPVDVQIIAQYSVPSLTTPATMETFTPLEEDEGKCVYVCMCGGPGGQVVQVFVLLIRESRVQVPPLADEYCPIFFLCLQPPPPVHPAVNGCLA